MDKSVFLFSVLLVTTFWLHVACPNLSSLAVLYEIDKMVCLFQCIFMEYQQKKFEYCHCFIFYGLCPVVVMFNKYLKFT